MKSKKIKTSVSITPELLAELTYEAKEFGFSRSHYIALVLEGRKNIMETKLVSCYDTIRQIKNVSDSKK